MAFRTVVISSRCKLEYSLNYLVSRTAESTKKILLDEIEVLIIQNIGVSITCALLSMLVEKKIKVIFCDQKANPQSELMPYYNSYCTYKKINQQFNVSKEAKDVLWQLIIKEKIYNEYLLLCKLEKNSSEKIKEYFNEVDIGDLTNREGHAAKVYFNSIFGKNFFREDADNPINKYLNYGYSILVSFINREVKSFGLLTEIGIHHIGETNPFNLSYDLIEPLRSLIDSFVVYGKVNDENYKETFQKILTSKVMYDDKEMFLDNAIHLYVQNTLSKLLNNDIKEIQFVKYEL